MKKSETICTLLGTSQNEMAMLFRINRSQWSMYESGKRSIPLEAKKLLGEMLTHVKLAKAEASDHPSQLEKQEIEKKLLPLLKENQYQQLVISRKVAALEKKQQNTAATLHLIDYLKNHADKTHIESMSKYIQIRVNKEMQSKGLPVLITHQIKLKVLQYEETLLKEALEK